MLFKDTADLKRILARINTKYSDSQVMAFVEQAEIKYLIPLIGQEFYEELDTAYAAVASIDLLSDDVRKALEKVQLALAYYAILDALPQMNVVIGQSGIHESNSANTTQSRQWVYNNLENSFASNADTFMDKLLEFLEKNADIYPTWKASDAYTESKEYFITQTSQFQSYINIFNSRRAFLAFRPFIKEAQEEILQKLIGDTYYSTLKTNIALDLTTAEDKAILKLAYPAIAYYAYANGLLQLCIQLTGSGLKVLNENDGIKQRLAASENQISSISNRYRPMADSKFNELKKYINDNADNYPDYKNSPAYTLPDTRQNYELPDNSNSKSFMV